MIILNNLVQTYVNIVFSNICCPIILHDIRSELPRLKVALVSGHVPLSRTVLCSLAARIINAAPDKLCSLSNATYYFE
jgi:uncharacterized membrane protein YGL010W